MTELLYAADSDSAYVGSFSATVRALPPGAIVLDRTFFYPVGGGQPADRGTVSAGEGRSLPIADVGRSAGVVLHRIGRARGAAGAPPRVGETVTGTLDWPRRYEHMRLHTAQHLASALLFRASAGRTREAVLGRGAATIELERPWPTELPREDLLGTFEEAVAGNRPVRVRHVDRAEYERSPAPRSGLIPLPSGIERVRLIEIEGYDASPCGGTHLRSTGEIGPVRWDPPDPAQPARVRFTLGPVEPPTPSG